MLPSKARKGEGNGRHMKTEQAGRLKLVEIVLLLFLAAFLATGAMALQTGQELSDKVVRLHVLANSDSEEDQALKLKVRDRILACTEPILTDSEFNCTLPGIEPICDQLKIKQICIDNVAKKANAQLKEFDFQNRPAVTDQIIEEIVEAYKARRGSVPMNLMKNHGNDNTLTGISEISLKKFLGGSWQPLIDLIVAGNIKGVAGVVGCSNLTAGGHDVLTVDLVKELIARDIIVLTAGCSSGGIENCGLMTPEAAQYAGPKLRAVCEKLGIPPVLNFGPCLAIGRLEIVATELAEALNVDLPQLPLVLSAAQWLEEQALADGCYGLALGLPLHLGLPPFITGSKVAVQVLTEDMKKLTGGQVIINSDAKASADILEQIILEKLQGLHI